MKKEKDKKPEDKQSSSKKVTEKPYYLTQEELDNLEKEAKENLEYWEMLYQKMEKEKEKEQEEKQKKQKKSTNLKKLK